MKNIIYLLFLSLIIVNCNSNITCSEYQWGYSEGEFDYYHPQFSSITNDGTHFDPMDQNISPQLIDQLTNQVEDCLHTTFPNSQLTDTVIHQSVCLNNRFTYPIDRKSFNIVVANNWVLSCDGSQQLLPQPVISGNAGCLAKGETSSIQCPCRWRAGIKCPNVLITTPSFYLYKDILIRWITNCSNPWNSPELVNCANPSTNPLSLGQ